MAPLAPLSEEPTIPCSSSSSKRSLSLRSWLKNYIPHLFLHKRSDLKLLLSVLACPLSPIAILPKHSLQVSSESQYIIHQFRATTRCSKIESGGGKNMFVAGRVKMVKMLELGLASSSNNPGEYHEGCFVMWQMDPDRWLIDLSVSGNRVMAGSDGKVAWRRTPWLSAHAARGAVRPVRRALQGLDPVTIAAAFSPAKRIEDRYIGDEECFVLKLSTDSLTLSIRSDNTAEIIKHDMIGYFSMRSGLLVQLDDSQLTRIEYPGAQALYWETIISSRIEDYREIDGVLIAHSGRSTVNLERFGVGMKTQRVSTQMEEKWTIDDVVFNVLGLSAECFIPPEEIKNT
ncbi:uncharacterized protein LOC120252489 [Dioscorea cayenensis subsp. rotundata]|uniref:Uncharacterized protein LOC120252489 n=1 Tax=Dioscorea cayennensis subsp. rotundata TaxID=55577 RepID=A0AB40APJ4_DIOCR|nr:uncharacterized protein LOC120252489 [Dioscorea cayenensis subsp. rotundata]